MRYTKTLQHLELGTSIIFETCMPMFSIVLQYLNKFLFFVKNWKYLRIFHISLNLWPESQYTSSTHGRYFRLD